MDGFALAAAIALASMVYATVGQAGGTAFLALMAIMNMPAGELRPTALALNVVAASYTTWRMHQAGLVDWRLLALVGGASLPAAFTGGMIVLEGNLYYTLTGAVLVATAILMVFRPAAPAGRPVRAWAAVIAGAVIGLLSGLTGVGGGVFLAPLLVVSGWTTARTAAALSAPFIFGNSIVGLAGTLIAGQQVAASFWLYAAGAMIGAAAGSYIGLRYLSERATRYMLGAVLAFAGIRISRS